MGKVVSCDRCKFRGFRFNGKSTEVYCEKGKRDFSDIKDENYKEKMEREIECDTFQSKYIEYPIKVSEITLPEKGGIDESWSAKCGDLVKVRPVDEKYEGKTYLGVFLGDADIGLHITHNPETKELKIHRHYNPAIFVPALKEIIYGASSWWGKIESEEELKEVTDDDIDNVWYVKMLKGSDE